MLLFLFQPVSLRASETQSGQRVSLSFQLNEIFVVSPARIILLSGTKTSRPAELNVRNRLSLSNRKQKNIFPMGYSQQNHPVFYTLIPGPVNFGYRRKSTILAVDSNPEGLHCPNPPVQCRVRHCNCLQEIILPFKTYALRWLRCGKTVYSKSMSLLAVQ